MDFLEKQREQIEAIRTRYNLLRHAKPEYDNLMDTYEYHHDVYTYARNMQSNIQKQINALQANMGFVEIAIMDYKPIFENLHILNSKDIDTAINALEESLQKLLRHYINLSKQYKIINNLISNPSLLKNSTHLYELQHAFKELRRHALDVHHVCYKGFFSKHNLENNLKTLNNINLDKYKPSPTKNSSPNIALYNQSFVYLKDGVAFVLHLTHLESKMQDFLTKNL